MKQILVSVIYVSNIRYGLDIIIIQTYRSVQFSAGYFKFYDDSLDNGVYLAITKLQVGSFLHVTTHWVITPSPYDDVNVMFNVELETQARILRMAVMEIHTFNRSIVARSLI